MEKGPVLLPDGTFVSTTYCVLKDGQKPLVVSVRFKLQDIDAKAALRPKKNLTK
jgi:dTDP-4-amino-4,6-dideoxygalactose transaminase